MLQYRTVGTLLVVSSLVVAGCSQEGDPSPVSGPELEGAATGTNPATADEPASPDVPHSDSIQHHYLHKVEHPHLADWSYEGDAGPEHWSSLDDHYVLAKTGKRQSPINITGALAFDLPAIAFDYHSSQINLIYNGHTVEEVEDKHSAIDVDGRHFVLQQFHFHAPSEHTVDGEHFAMEMHLVHQSADGAIVVVGVLIKEGQDNPAFDAVWDYLPSASNRERIEKASVDAATMLPADRAYYRYSGSYTTPPCTEGVLWMVMTSPVELSAEQIAKFRAVISGNNRPIQPLNGRELQVSQP